MKRSEGVWGNANGRCKRPAAIKGVGWGLRLLGSPGGSAPRAGSGHSPGAVPGVPGRWRRRVGSAAAGKPGGHRRRASNIGRSDQQRGPPPAGR